jgi:hypothetical protein
MPQRKLTVREMACRDGPSPEYAIRCIRDDEVLTQLRFPNQPDYHNQLREYVSERELSLVRGSMPVAEALRAATGRRWVPQQVAAAAVRVIEAGVLRTAGFAVVHTSMKGTKVASPTHVSVVWPDSDPLDYQAVPWPSEAVDAWQSCFNG